MKNPKAHSHKHRLVAKHPLTHQFVAIIVEHMNAETQQTPSIQDIVRQETDNGMLIVRFLVSVIEGEIPDTKLWHRLDATRQLRKLGFDYAAALETVRAEPVEAPDPDTNAPSLRSLPQSAGAAVPPLPQGEGRGEGDTTDTNGEPATDSVGAVREPPIPAPDPHTNGASPRHSGIPATAGTGEEAGIQWGGGAPPIDPADADPGSVRAEPVEAPNPEANGTGPPINTAGLNEDLARFIRTETDGGRQIMRFFVDVMLGFLPMFKPHLRMDAAKELMRHGFEGPAPTAPVRAEPVEAPAPDTNGTGPRHSGIPATAGTGEEAGIQRGGATPTTDSADADPEAVRAEPAEAPTPDTNGASFLPLPQGEGQGEGDALDYEPPYVNTYGHSEDDGFNTRAVFKAADALMDAVGRLPQTPADIEAARRSRKHSIIVHNGNEHYFSECSRGAVESAIATREVMEAVRRIRDSCRTPSAFEPVDDAYRSVRADPVLSPSKGPVEAPHESVRAEPVEAPDPDAKAEPASVGAVREPPDPAPDPDANAPDALRHLYVAKALQIGQFAGCR